MAHRIVILGGGTGGTLTANRLRKIYPPEAAENHDAVCHERSKRRFDCPRQDRRSSSGGAPVPHIRVREPGIIEGHLRERQRERSICSFPFFNV
jgi:hypothetical protein